MIQFIDGAADRCPIIFLHGFLEDNSMWDFIIEKDYFVNPLLLIELPGHGNSSFELQESISGIATAIHAQLMSDYSYKKFHIVGHSLGGYVALQLKQQFPDFYAQTVLLNSHPLADSPQKKIDRLRVVDIVEKNSRLFLHTAIPALFLERQHFESEINDLIRNASKMSVKAIQMSTIAMRNRDDKAKFYQQNIDSISIVYGELDTLVPIERLLEVLGDSNSIDVIEGGGHMCHLEEKKATIFALKKYLLG